MIWSRIKRILVGVLAGLTLLAAMLAGARKSGRDSARAKELRKDLGEAEKANEIKDRQLDVAVNRPRGSDDVDKRMRDRSF